MDVDRRDAYLKGCRDTVISYLTERFDTRGPDAELYRAVLDYPLREAKGLRPGLCIATCRALGGRLEEAVPSAATIELFHNAFLIHDDVEDGSDLRRDSPSLHQMVGEAFAINVGDAMLAHSLRPLLENMELLDVGRALEILDVVAEMSRVSAEGQAMELSWIRNRRWDIQEDDYIRMVTKKTACYTFVTPLEMGAIVAERRELRPLLRDFATPLGVAFQIQDDVLNLVGEPEIGKEPAGDLWEGKRTLAIAHFLASGTSWKVEKAKDILRRARPTRRQAQFLDLLRDLQENEGLSAVAAERLSTEVLPEGTKSAQDIEMLGEWLRDSGSIVWASGVARRYSDAAEVAWRRLEPELGPSDHADLLASVAAFVIERSW